LYKCFLHQMVQNRPNFEKFVKIFICWGQCSSHASATATCEQSRTKQEGKDQASDTYK